MPKKTATKAKEEAADFRVRIRMYRHGLGDCFLLSFPKKNKKLAHMLIDCGVVLGTGDPGVVMKQVAQDVRTTTGGRLDVLVITHEHWDHLSGFDGNQAREVFDNIEIDALWLAWTEDEKDDLAKTLRHERELKKKAALKAKSAAADRGMDGVAKRMDEVLGFFGARPAESGSSGQDDGGSTGGALKYLKGRRKETILDTGSQLPIPGVDGVRIYVVGPPHDGDAMKKTNPFKGEGYGLNGEPLGLTDAFLAAFDPADELSQPFARELRNDLQILRTATGSAPDGETLGVQGYYHPNNAWRMIDDAWLATGERLALQLDNATNNTSLVLAFELEDNNDVLLFVGDAQAGNWRSWEKRKWKVKGQDGETREVTAADLLSRTIFYKVGHHGSHNATLKDKGLELMKSDRLVACIPVDTKVAHDVKGWEHMPLPAIRKRLDASCAIVFQSDAPPSEHRKVPGARWKHSEETFEVRMKNPTTKKMETKRTQPLYTDYFV